MHWMLFQRGMFTNVAAMAPAAGGGGTFVPGMVASAYNTSPSFPGLNLGPADADREIIAQISWADSSAVGSLTPLASVTLTVGGTPISGTLLYRTTGNNYKKAEYWGFVVPSGIVGDLVCSDNSANRWSVTLHAYNDLVSMTPTATGAVGSNVGPSLAIPAGGFMLAIGVNNNDSVNRVFTNITHLYTATVSGGTSWTAFHGEKHSVAGETIAATLTSGSSATLATYAACWARS
jgi:hypothetical protein